MRNRSVRITVDKVGKLAASMPTYAPMFTLKSLVKTSRPKLRLMLAQHSPAYRLENGETIGKTHKLIIVWGAQTSVKLIDKTIVVHLKDGDKVTRPSVEQAIRMCIKKALQADAKAILTPMIYSLSQEYGYSFERLKFTHASTRWGSCSTTGTISLNIALMKVPDNLIRYVLVHELAHTKQLNHSTKFWGLVAKADPSYKLHRKMLKKYNPTI